MTEAAPMLSVGSVHPGASRTITDVEVAMLPALMGAISPLFHDAEAASKGELGRRVLYGPALLGIAIAATEPILRPAVIALLGITDVRFLRPVGVGDTVTASFTVTARRVRVGKPGDVLSVHDEVHNQLGEQVLEFVRNMLVRSAQE